MLRLIVFTFLVCCLTALHCKQENLAPDVLEPQTLSILALGDSYTKGESVPWAQNYPNQLVDSLMTAGYDIQGIRSIAQTGWRTDQLQNAISNASGISDSSFELVLLCIGVNNQYQNGNLETFKTQFSDLLQTAIAQADGKKERVIVLSIPDWAYTPYGQNYPGDPSTVSQKIDIFNAEKQKLTKGYGILFVDVTSISREGLEKPLFVATDGLHPSAIQYSKWVSKLIPLVKKALKN